MASNYFNRRKAQIANRETGYVNRLFVAPTDFFTTIAEPEAPFVNPGDNKKIATAHVFAADKGFIEMLCAQDSVEAPAQTAGDIGSKKATWSPVGFLPGDGPDVQAMVEDLLNDDVILILEDANCPGGPNVQFGCHCKPARVESFQFTSGTTATDGRKGYLLTFSAYCRFFYSGEIEVLPDPVTP